MQEERRHAIPIHHGEVPPEVRDALSSFDLVLRVHGRRAFDDVRGVGGRRLHDGAFPAARPQGVEPDVTSDDRGPPDEAAPPRKGALREGRDDLLEGGLNEI
ncbi:MAG TPA: hypothetical protein VGM56_21115, partial [Byssovorax sp.]